MKCWRVKLQLTGILSSERGWGRERAGVIITPVASCRGNRKKLLWDVPLGSRAKESTFTYFVNISRASSSYDFFCS